MHRYILCLLVSILCLLVDATNVSNHLVPAEIPLFSTGTANWLNHGGNNYNRRYASGESLISPLTASKLRLKWSFNTGNDVSATPAIFNGILYFPSWNGYIYALNQLDGSLVWKKNLQALTGLTSTNLLTNITVSRATPTIADDDKLIIAICGPAYVIAVNRSTGDLLWKTQLDDQPASIITMSGSYFKRAFYVGVSSLQSLFPPEYCCTFRGSFAKLDIETGSILWKTFMLPDNGGMRGGYAGASVWGSSPSIDLKRNQVYIGTAQLYSVPESVANCQRQQNNQTSPTHGEQCIPPENHFDSMLALDLDSGIIRWFRQLGGYDVWYIACSIPNSPSCPPGPNRDADFGEAPMMLTIVSKGRALEVVVATQKSGFAWALDRDNGNIVWYTEAGPGGTYGGGTWGSATDNVRIYTNIVNNQRKNFTLTPSKNVTTGGGWVAMDAQTGKILWSTALPYNATANGPVTIANGVLFAGSTYRTGPVYALNASSGKILWSYETGATVYGGFSVSNGCAYIGNGYRSIPGFTPGTSLFAFCVY